MTAVGDAGGATPTEVDIASNLAISAVGPRRTAARRPALSVGGLAEVEQLLAVREPLYRACADAEIAVDRVSPEQAADAILAAWELRSPKPSG